MVIVFNYSSDTHSKEFLRSLYAPYFKHILFYSDTPSTNDTEINFMYIYKGVYTTRIFSHLYSKYKALIDESDGLFYTMDDNIINPSLLDTLDFNKIICDELQTGVPLESTRGWHWDNAWGKPALRKLSNDPEFQRYGYTLFSGCFSDYFYLPKRYLTPSLFLLFSLYSKYEVFLELAIPSILHNIERDPDRYMTMKTPGTYPILPIQHIPRCATLTSCVLWNSARNKLLDKQFFTECMKTCAVIHPLKFTSNPVFKDWLIELLKCPSV